MLKYKHPKSRYVPHVQLSLRELGELCNELLANWTHGEAPSYAVSFQGTDGSEISTSDVALITPDNERVPSLIVEPTIIASADDDVIELRPQIVPASSPGSSASSYYVFNVTGSRQGWSASVIDTTFAWLLRRRQGTFRFHYPIVGILLGLGIASLVTALVSGTSGNPPVTHLTARVIALLVAGVGFAVAGIAFNGSMPRFSVVVRPTTNYLTLANIAAVIGILGGLFAIYNEGMKAIGR